MNLYNEIEPFANRGRLTVMRLIKGAKNKHPLAECRCECGRGRTVRQSTLRRGFAKECSYCSHRAGWENRARLSMAESKTADRISIYKNNAKKKGRQFLLSNAEAAQLLNGVCRYCGIIPACGIDRIDNSLGYDKKNSAPCCAKCNYSKRDMTEYEFLSWARSVVAHNGAAV